MPPHASVKLFAAQATTGTTAYTSAVFSPSGNGNFDFQFAKTGTGTGSLALQTNNSLDVEHLTDGTTNWVQHDMAAGTGVTGGAIDVAATNPLAIKVKLRGLSARRCRWVYTNATGTTVINGWASGN